jgi:catechol 2,3-dioxygenase-like lactoylglutathione lyase family enzyme
MLNTKDVIAFVPTRDAEKSKAFYEDELGLRFVSDDKFAMVFDANGTMLRIARVPNTSAPRSPSWDGTSPGSRRS